MKINTFLVVLIASISLAHAGTSTIGGLRVMSENHEQFLIIFLRSTEGIVWGHLYKLDGTYITELSWINLIGNIIQTMFYECLPNIDFQFIEELPPNAFSFTDST